MNRALCSVVAALLLPTSSWAARLPTGRNLEVRLAEEVQKMMDAGHLRPAKCRFEQHCVALYEQGWELDDYWSNPAELVYTLAIAIPLLPASMQQPAKDYLHQEFAAFPPTNYIHMGPSGARREYQDLAPEVEAAFGQKFDIRSPMTQADAIWPGWNFNPFNVYACWKYAQLFPGEAQSVFDAVKGKLTALPADTAFLSAHPHVINQYIAGYYGYLGLQDLLQQPHSTQVQGWLDNALAARTAALAVDPVNLFGSEAGGFVFLVPELGEYLFQNARPRVEQVIAYQNWAAPYWHIARAEETSRAVPGHAYLEGYHQIIYETHSQFLARAYALKWERRRLEQRLDISGVGRGDLYLIQNMVATLVAAGEPPPDAGTGPVDDAGTSPTDGGSTAADGGAPPQDSADAGPDSGGLTGSCGCSSLDSALLAVAAVSFALSLARRRR